MMQFHILRLVQPSLLNHIGVDVGILRAEAVCVDMLPEHITKPTHNISSLSVFLSDFPLLLSRKTLSGVDVGILRAESFRDVAFAGGVLDPVSVLALQCQSVSFRPLAIAVFVDDAAEAREDLE